MAFIGRALLALIVLASAGPAAAQQLTLYSGRGETLVEPIIQSFTERTGLEVKVRYGGTAELAVLLKEEGEGSPADLYWAQDVSALGAVADLFEPLPASTVAKVSDMFRDRAGRWVGTSGRARLIVYSPERMKEDELPATMAEVVHERYKGRMALAPSNGSFLAQVTALRAFAGEEVARRWLEGIAANDPVIVRNNTAAHQAIADGEADFAISNNYYLPRFLAQDPEYPVRQALFEKGDIGNMMMVAGIGVLKSSKNKEAAVAFVDFLLGLTAQQYFTGNAYEYPVSGESIAPVSGLGVTHKEAEENAPQIDLNGITDLEGTLKMLREVGLL